MASVRAFFNRFLFLLIHLGCFAIFSATNPNPSTQQDQQPSVPPKPRKITPLSPSSSSNLKPHKSFSRSLISYLKHLLSWSSNNVQPQQHRQTTATTTPPSPSPSPLQSIPFSPPTTPPTLTSSSSSIQHDLSLATARRDDIFPCSACGEVLYKPQLLEIHQVTKHSLSQLRDGESGKNIIQIIFHSGWRGTRPPLLHRILRIHNSPKTLARFEEYRGIVRSRAARSRGAGDERCVADGNERLRFYCSTVLCALGRINGPSQVGVCGSQYCSTCGIVRHGFAGKQVDLEGIATHATGWGAHLSLPEELEREFAFLHVRRAVVVCRVVAGRVARGGEEEKKGEVFDSVVPVPRRGNVEEEELLVFNPRALLPCFVIVYSAA